MTTSNRLFANISTIYMATAQSTIFYLLRIIQSFCYFASPKYLSTANRQIISTLEIFYVFGYCAQKNCINSNRHFWKHINDYMATAQSQFLGYCTSIILLLRISQLFKYCISTNYLTTGNRLHNCLPCIQKLYDNFKSPIWKHINDLYGTCAKHNFLATAHLSFSYGASPNYFSTAN